MHILYSSYKFIFPAWLFLRGHMKDILKALSEGRLSVEDAERKLRGGFLDLEIAKLDLERDHKAGVAEVILAEGKEPEEVLELGKRLLEEKGLAIITRAREEDFENFKRLKCEKRLNKKGRVIVLGGHKSASSGKVGILAAGTSDLPAAEEAKEVCLALGLEAFTEYDVGIAGMHRLLPSLKRFLEADVDVIIAAAGMEGALPSVVKGLCDVPVIGVPTSVGYGLGKDGIGALTAMLQSCSPGIAVVNIDNGFGAAALAYLICKRISRFRD